MFDTLGSQLTYNAEAVLALNGITPEQANMFHRLTHEAEFITHSLESFCREQNKPDSYFNQDLLPNEASDPTTLTRCLMPHEISSIPDAKYKLVSRSGHKGTDIGKRVVEEEEKSALSSFYFDTQHSLVLYYSVDPKIACVCGFDFANRELQGAKKQDFLECYPPETFKNGDIFIRQLQGPTYGKFAPNELRWPLILTQLVVEWSRQTGIPRVFLQPYDRNTWSMIHTNIDGRGKQRYDKTAQRCGFTRSDVNLPFVWNNLIFNQPLVESE